MSRGVRDLRELICVSRLTVRGSDEEIISEDENDLLGTFSSLSLPISSSTSNGKHKQIITRQEAKSPDSGCVTNGNSPVTEMSVPAEGQHKPCPPPSQLPTAARKRRKRKRKPLESHKHELPKVAPLPPVRSESQVSWTSSSSEGMPSSGETRKICTNFDFMFMYMDPTVISEWLQISNHAVADLAEWCDKNDNFVHFAHFWISDFPDVQRHEIFKLEHGILLDHLNLVFASGRDVGKIKHRDLVSFLDAVFREYPAKLLSSKGTHLFLDHLDVLSSERQHSYKDLLSNVKLSTRNKQHAQWCLAVRAFALVSIWTAVVNFYRKLVPHNFISKGLPLLALSKKKSMDVNTDRLYQAIRHGYVDVVHYYLGAGKIDPQIRDSHGKTLVFMAVMHRQLKVLKYLLTQVKPNIDVNMAADTGNTPLHAAANSGDASVVAMLVECDNILIDPVNKQCDNATPLHLAVLHGHKEVVKVLLEVKASTKKKMGELSPLDIARDFGHEEILSLIEKVT